MNNRSLQRHRNNVPRDVHHRRHNRINTRTDPGCQSNDVRNLTHIERNLNYFMDKFASMICVTCNQGFNSTDIYHHNGHLNQLIYDWKNITESDINNYFADTEHGFFHGLFTAFISDYLSSETPFINTAQRINLAEYKRSSLVHHGQICYEYDTNFKLNELGYAVSPEQIKTITSCLMHDFLKTKGHPNKDHDTNLNIHCPNLIASTYTHASDPDEKSSLVIGDRIELYRYDDFAEWVNPELMEFTNNIDEDKLNEIAFLYKHIRPALLSIYKKRHEIWIRHGMEIPQEYDNLDAHYPHRDSFLSLGSHVDSYPIEIDSYPFENCFSHKNDTMEYIYTHLAGMIPASQFKQLGGTIANPNDFPRDHLYANKYIDINQWIFVYDDYIETYHPSLLDKIINHDIRKIISQSTINKFSYIEKIFRERLLILCQ